YLELQPSNAWANAICGEARYELAASQGSVTNLDLALGNLDRALELDPEIVRAYFVRGNARYLMRKWDGARQDYRRYCELNPSDASYPSFFIWLIHARGGERAAADKELSACLDKLRKGDYGPWQKKIGALLLDRLGEAEFLRAAHVRDTGEQCEAWYYAGMKRQLAGDLATAKDYFQKCVATARKDFFEYNFAAAELKAME
ncbi:MAG: Lipoprotein NlpI, partial [Pedosphaera sp.]|nr:Lipoprotein NlpI [Pedosphaera sp.]